MSEENIAVDLDQFHRWHRSDTAREPHHTATCRFCRLISEVEDLRKLHKGCERLLKDHDKFRDRAWRAEKELDAAQTGFKAAVADLGKCRAECKTLRQELRVMTADRDAWKKGRIELEGSDE